MQKSELNYKGIKVLSASYCLGSCWLVPGEAGYTIYSQNEIVERIEEEKKVVEANRGLVKSYEGRIEGVIGGVWGEKG